MVRHACLPLLLVAALVAVPGPLAAAAPPAADQPAAAASLRVTVQDETRARLIHAVVTLVGPDGVEHVQPVDEQGVATFTGLPPGVYQVAAAAEGFRTLGLPVTLRRGDNQTTLRLSVAMQEEIVVNEADSERRGASGFTTTLTQAEIDMLSDDPDEMEEQLRQMAGPGAQIFVDGFRGGRLPPKDQIQQIRFQTNSFSAEYHEAGMVRIDVVTRPGFGGWRGTANFGFRDQSLNARHAFAPERGPEQQKRYMFNFSGPLQEGRTSFAFSVDGLAAYDSQTIVAALPGGAFADQVRRPTDRLNTSVRLDHAISAGGQIRAEFQRRTDDRRNLGVGDFDLLERAYRQEQASDIVRARNTQVLGRRAFSEVKFEYRSSETTLTSASEAPAIRVLDAFTGGGAGQGGVRQGREIELAHNLDLTAGRHSLRAGILLQSGWWDSAEQRNANGTFTFRTIEDYLAGRPSQFSRRVGDPAVSYSHHQFAWYIQDDFRPLRDLSLSVGLRHELQTNLGDHWNFAPRAGFTWSPRGRRINVRGGYGTFYDWFEANLYEQTLRVDGTRQLEEVLINPSYPDPVAEAANVLPPSVIRASDTLEMPTIHQASIGFDRPLTETIGVRADYMFQRGTSQFRSINANAPIDGVRPDPAIGNITQIESTGRSALDRLTVGLNLRVPARRMFGNVMYQLGSSRNHTNNPLMLPSDSTNPDADWGPAMNDVRHRLFLMLNTPTIYGVRAGLMVQGSSGMPYTITTGFDDNGDTVFHDRPAGVGRNSERGAAQWNANLRLNRSIGLGGPRTDGGMPVPPPPPGGGGAGASPLSQRGPGAMGGGEGGGPGIVIMDGANTRYRLDLYAQISNLFNRTNYMQFVGNQLSPFFGQPTAAMPPRRVEIGASLSF